MKTREKGPDARGGLIPAILSSAAALALFLALCGDGDPASRHEAVCEASSASAAVAVASKR